MKIQGNIYRVKGHISNVYLIDDDMICIVDSGCPNDFPLIQNCICGEIGKKLRDTDLIVPTHSHIEHMGYSPQIRAKTGGRVALPLKEVNPARGSLTSFRFLRKMPRAILAGLRNNPRLLLYPHLHLRKVRADVVLEHGEKLPGHEEWTVLYTPGHSPDSICLYSDRRECLISGDTVISIEGRPALPFGIWDHGKMRRSLELLRALDVRLLLPGHGEPLEGNNLLDGLALPSQVNVPSRGIPTNLAVL